jgi:phage shock protein A
MTLATRIARLFRADLNALLDRIEEPGALLSQALREMGEDLDRDAATLRNLQREAERLAARGEELRSALARLDEELDLCFAASQDSLAKALIKRKLELLRAEAALTRRRAALDAERGELEARVRENRARLDHVRQQAEALPERPPPSPAPAEYIDRDSPIRAEEVEVAFLREQQRRSQP